MKRGMLFLLAMICMVVVKAQDTIKAFHGVGSLHSYSGTVVSDVNGQPLSGASVTSGSISVVTNDDGFFILKSVHPLKGAVVSHLGYRSQNIGFGQEKLVVRLKPTSIQLQEVLVMADNPRELVNAAISKIPYNYSRRPEFFHCFYRETAMKRQHYICVAEGVVDMFKTSYERDASRDQVAISKGRRLLSPRQSDTLSVKVIGGPVLPLQLDLVKKTDILLTSEELDCYTLKMEVPTSIGNRQQYVVSLSPKVTKPYPLYFGRLYIDRETLAFTRAELSLDMRDRKKASDMMLVKKPMGVRFRPKELTMLVDYRLGDDGYTRMSYLRTTFRFNCDWRRRLFATSFTACCEMAVTDHDDSQAKPISGRRSFDQRDAFFDKVDYFRDPTFWQDYNIIEPTETIDRAVNRLLKKY